MTKAQSDIFATEEADNYFDRNKYSRAFIADYVLSLFPKQTLSSFQLAEFGIGGGQNLLLFKNYVQTVHGFGASEKAIECYRQFYSSRPDANDFKATQVNLCKPFKVADSFDLILYGFFAYYVSDSELAIVKSNAISSLKETGYILVNDFLTRKSRHYPDKRNPKLQVYKRDLAFWINHMCEFDLINFQLFDDESKYKDLMRDEFRTINPLLSQEDSNWTFAALFRKRT